jgi:hypothetical protein
VQIIPLSHTACNFFGLFIPDLLVGGMDQRGLSYSTSLPPFHGFLVSATILQQDYVPTVFENFVADVEIATSRVEVALWDTGGQDDYARLRSLCYPGAHVVLICFAVVGPDSVDDVQEKVGMPYRTLHIPDLSPVFSGCLRSCTSVPKSPS